MRVVIDDREAHAQGIGHLVLDQRPGDIVEERGARRGADAGIEGDEEGVFADAVDELSSGDRVETAVLFLEH